MGSYLYASPSFWSGASRLLDLGNTFDQYNHSQTGKEADSLGILMDWDAVGQDLWICFERTDAGFPKKRVHECLTTELIER